MVQEALSQKYPNTHTHKQKEKEKEKKVPTKTGLAKYYLPRPPKNKR
jgi:hypothetical protein